MESLKRVIAERLRSARQEAGLTQAELADLAGINENTYGNYEREESWIPIENLAKVREVVDKPVEYFFGLGTVGLSDDELILLEIYRSLPDWLKELAIEILRVLQKQKGT